MVTLGWLLHLTRCGSDPDTPLVLVPVSRPSLPLLRSAAALLLLAGCNHVVADPVLVSNSSVDLESVTLNTSRLIFSMQLDQWPNGSAVRVFVLPDDNPAHRAFSKDRLSLYPRQLRRAWDRQLYSGTGQAPETVADEEAMRRAVGTTPGAVGYLSRKMLDDTVQELQIDD